MKSKRKHNYITKVLSIIMVFMLVFSTSFDISLIISSSKIDITWTNKVVADTPATGSALTGPGFSTFTNSFPGQDGNIYNFADFKTIKVYDKNGTLLRSYPSGAIQYDAHYDYIYNGTILIHNYGGYILVMYNMINFDDYNNPYSRQYVTYYWNGSQYVYQGNGNGGMSYTQPMSITGYGYVYYWSAASTSLYYVRFSDMYVNSPDIYGSNGYYLSSSFLYNFGNNPVKYYTGSWFDTQYTPSNYPASLVESQFGIYTGNIAGTQIKYTSKMVNGNGSFYMLDGSGIVYAVKNNNPILGAASLSPNNSFSEISGYESINIQGTIKDMDNGEKGYVQYNIDGGSNQYATLTSGKSGNDGHDYILADGTSKSFVITPLSVSHLAEGNHTLNIFAIDGKNGVSSTVQIPFKVDKSAPTIGSMNMSSTATSITASDSATDNIAGLNPYPYRYSIGTSISTDWINNTSYTQPNLVSNMQYNVKFEARDLVGHIANKTGDIYTKAAVPNLTLTNIKPYNLTVQTTDTNSTPTEYQIKVNNGEKYITPEGTLTTSPVWITLPNKNITVTGLTPSTTYTFTAKARNAEGIETAWSAPISGTTLIEPPAAPANITAVSTSSNISVVWDPAAGSTGYDIEADGVIRDNGTYTSYNHTGLTPYTQHTYRVRAKNEGGAGSWSAPISKYTQQDTPNTPFNIDTAATNTSIIVTWKPIPGATAYDIEADGIIINNYSSTNYVHTGLIPGTMHAYRVRSINSGGKSEWSNEVLVSTQSDTPIIPSNVAATPDSAQITISWDAIPGATYEIEIDGNIKDNGTNTSYVHTGLLPGTEHNYRVRTQKSGSTSDWSALTTAMVPVDEFGTPKNIKTEVSDTTVTLSWSPVFNATGYEVEVDGQVLDNSTETSCVFNGLTPSTQYTYRVRALGSEEPSDWSEAIAVTTYALPTPANLQTTAAESVISLIWEEVPGAESYELDIDGQLIEGITTNAYLHEDLVPSTQHSYRVRAKGSNGFSSWSDVHRETTVFAGPTVPTGILAKSMTNAIQLLWKPLPEADSYEVEIDGGSLQSTAAATYNHSGLTAATTHSYRIRAIVAGVEGPWSEPIQAATLAVAPAVPTGVTVSSNLSSIFLTWDKVENAEAYELEVDGTVIQAGTNTKYLHSGLLPETSHTYRVRAKGTTTQSPWSAPVTASTKSAVQTYVLQSENNQVFNLTLTAKEITDPTKYTYTLSYNSDELELLDLCGETAREDLSTGNLIGTDIQVMQFTPGTVVFKKLGSANGQAWSGYINSIRFKSKKDGDIQIIYSIQ